MLSRRKVVLKKIVFVFCFLICWKLLLTLVNNVLSSDESTRRMFLESCNCTKVYTLSPPANGGPESFCSKESTAYGGSHQRVVSYSLFRSSETAELSTWGVKEVEKGLLDNLMTMRRHFPGWILRVYSNLEMDGLFCSLRCQNPDFFWCDIRNIPENGNLSEMDYRTWRFLPLGDPTVDVFLSRDLDSVLSARDAAAVKDWLENTTKAFHVFRDRSVHNAPVMGGLWGGRNDMLSSQVAGQLHESLLNQSSLTSKNRKGFDQGFLYEWIYSPHLQWFVGYDAYNCQIFSGETLIRPFPTQRNGSEFLGSPTLWNESFQAEVCPESCRPNHGKSWIYC
ncbi:hypothetical protein Ocin01_13742 [Orchesella cincta]|uniref:Uncharacterized protein n=1 Tax=Orchesella cincta TaxID=48709 RepID=A0A1D2MIZ6_ORCCI|nr:hypothetical protein Ocin01_13742 [Orchesella cincta]